MIRILAFFLILTLFACKKEDCPIDETTDYYALRSNIYGEWDLKMVRLIFKDDTLNNESAVINHVLTLYHDQTAKQVNNYTGDIYYSQWYFQLNHQVIIFKDEYHTSNYAHAFSISKNTPDKQIWEEVREYQNEVRKDTWTLTKN